MKLDEDQKLMLKCKKGNEQAFRLLYMKYRKKIINYCYRFFSETRIAEEITQEVFIKIYKAAPDYKPEAKFSSWLFRIATNTCINEVKKNKYLKKAKVIDEEKLKDTGKSIHGEQLSLVAKAEQNKIIQETILKLPPKQRAAILLRLDHEFSYSEIAIQLNCSESSIKSLIFRARETLKNSLENLHKELKE